MDACFTTSDGQSGTCINLHLQCRVIHNNFNLQLATRGPIRSKSIHACSSPSLGSGIGLGTDSWILWIPVGAIFYFKLPCHFAPLSAPLLQHMHAKLPQMWQTAVLNLQTGACSLVAVTRNFFHVFVNSMDLVLCRACSPSNLSVLHFTFFSANSAATAKSNAFKKVIIKVQALLPIYYYCD